VKDWVAMLYFKLKGSSWKNRLMVSSMTLTVDMIGLSYTELMWCWYEILTLTVQGFVWESYCSLSICLNISFGLLEVVCVSLMSRCSRYKSVVPNLLWPRGVSYKKYPMGHFAMLTPHEQLVETVLHAGQWPFYQRFIEHSFWICGPAVVHLGSRLESMS